MTDSSLIEDPARPARGRWTRADLGRRCCSSTAIRPARSQPGRQFASPLAERYRLIAFDLPGHGASSDAPDPARTYSIHGLADAAIAALETLAIDRAVIVGWSLGGHCALEVLARWPGSLAAWITGTPPVGASPADMAAGFIASPHMELTFKAQFTEAEARTFAQDAVGDNVVLEPWMLAACRRADGRFRPMMLQSAMAGADMDERAIVAGQAPGRPLAVVTGEREPFVNNPYLAEPGLPQPVGWAGACSGRPGTYAVLGGPGCGQSRC